MWDGNNPLHEWVEYKQTATQTINAQNTRQQDADADIAAIASRNALSTVLEHQGPPSGKARFNEGTQAQPITWLFEPDSFTPMAKLVGDEHYSIITDHLGTPSTIFDKDGKQVWSADISVWGELRNLHGDKDFCPFRYPGQYEDSETGLYCNRFRYYDPEAGRYVSQDPIRLAGGINLYGYVNDPALWVDPLGLSKRRRNGGNSNRSAAPSCGAKPKPSGPVIDFDENGNEILYRTMSEPDFKTLQRTGRLPGTTETSLSPSEDYSRGYDGVLVKLTTKPGTSAKLQEIGIAANKPAADALSLPEGKGPWNMEHARFKAERGIINTQLGTSKIIDGKKTEGRALEVFNDNLIDFEQLPKDTT